MTISEQVNDIKIAITIDSIENSVSIANDDNGTKVVLSINDYKTIMERSHKMLNVIRTYND